MRVGSRGPIASDMSPKSIDGEGLGKHRTEIGQDWANLDWNESSPTLKRWSPYEGHTVECRVNKTRI